MSLSIQIFGDTHLAQTLRRAAEMRGMHAWADGDGDPMPDLLFAATDVLDHDELAAAERTFRQANAISHRTEPLVLVSQVPPGTTRRWSAGHARPVYYQVDTIIMRRALQRAYRPEQIIVGCRDMTEPLPLAYQEYLLAHECRVLQMTYEEAELTKCAINFFLAAQVEATAALARAAEKLGVDWSKVAEAVAGDARIGKHAYLRPGKINQHLARDCATIGKILEE